MKTALRYFAFALVLLATTSSYAAFHLFRIDQLYSNADGSVQFIVMHELLPTSGENLWFGQKISSTGAGGPKTFFFPQNLPYSDTGGRRVLIASQGFVDLGLIKPEYVMPNGFLSTGGGSVNYADVDTLNYSALPTDGVNALDHSGAIVKNLATNMLGQTASVGAAPTPPAAIVPADGVWADPDPAKPGTGFAMAYRHGVLVVAIYSYQMGGAAQWYLLSGNLTNNVFTATLDKYTSGQCISCAYVGPTVTGNDGTLTITFTSSTAATVTYPGGRTGAIAPFAF